MGRGWRFWSDSVYYCIYYVSIRFWVLLTLLPWQTQNEWPFTNGYLNFYLLPLELKVGFLYDPAVICPFLPGSQVVIILFLVFFGARLQGGSSCLEKNHGLQQPWLPLCGFECDGLWSSSGGLDMKSYVERNSCKVLVGILQCLTKSRSLLCIGVKWFWEFLTCSIHSALLGLRLGLLCRLRWRKKKPHWRVFDKTSLMELP